MSLPGAFDRPELGAHLEVLRGQLAQRAGKAGLLGVSYRTVPSPLGELLLAATEAGLVRLAFHSEGFDQVLTGLSDQVGPRLLAHSAPLDAAARELEECFAGRRRNFDLPLDLRLTRGFRRQLGAPLAPLSYV